MNILNLFRKTPRLCENCKHWGTNRATEWYCDGVEDGTQKLCGCHKITDGEVSSPAPDVASAVDCEKYHAFLLTGPRFGCIHWEASLSKPGSSASE